MSSAGWSQWPVVSSDNCVKSCQTVRTDTDPIQQSQCPHQEDGSQGALLLPAAEGCGDGVVQRPCRPGALESGAKFDVFHQRDVGEAAELFEDVAEDEHRLVAGGDARQSGAEIDKGADNATPGGMAVKPDVEASADHGWIGESRFNGLSGAIRQAGVRVKKQEDLAAGGFGPGIELPRPSRLTREAPGESKRFGFSSRLSGASAVHHDDLIHVQTCGVAKGCDDRLLFIENGNDDSNRH